MVTPSSEEKPLYSHVVLAVSFPYDILLTRSLTLTSFFAYKLPSLLILPFLLLTHYHTLTINNPNHNDMKANVRIASQAQGQ